jgi:prevent-host-death family protein
MITVTSVEAQNRFGQLLDTVQREPVTITRHGRTAAFIVSPQDMKDLQEARRKRDTAVEAFDAYFARADAALTPAARELTDEDVVRMVKASR